MAKPPNKRATMLDVAELSGVSYQTVSRVINNHPSVAPETRRRVQKVIAQLNYHPSKAARTLAARQSHTLAVITHGMEYYGPAQMVVNIEHYARKAGYDLVFANVSPISGEGLNAAVDRLMRWSVDGLLMIAPVDGEYYKRVGERLAAVPFIQIDIMPGSAHPSVIIDQHAGSAIVTEHLLALGHTRIAEISGPQNWFGAAARHQAVIETLNAAGLAVVASIEGDWTSKSGYDAANWLVKRHEFTAMVVGNDQMAMGAISALNNHGLRVPEDVSVVGFDDIPEAAYFHPPLTTIRQNFPALGQAGLSYLMTLIEDPDAEDGQHVIMPDLIERRSTCPPKA